MRSRVIVGRDVDVIRDEGSDVELMGRVRLRPGFVVEIIPGARGRGLPGGTVLVTSWRIRVLGSNGPIYRGVCHRFPSARSSPSEPAGSGAEPAVPR